MLRVIVGARRETAGAVSVSIRLSLLLRTSTRLSKKRGNARCRSALKDCSQLGKSDVFAAFASHPHSKTRVGGFVKIGNVGGYRLYESFRNGDVLNSVFRHIAGY